MIEKISWRGWNNVFRISNDMVQVLVLADVGPRVIWYGFNDGENILYEVLSDTGRSGDHHFRLYGGHRLWVSPEVERTYFPDNRPVTVEQKDDRILFTAPVEDSAPGTHLQKQIEVRLDPAGSGIQLRHCVINLAIRATELASWTPTMMKAGGRAVLPLPPRAPMDKDHFLPVGPLTLWSFTDLADPRWRLGTEFIQLAQSTAPAGRFEEQMTGIFNPWGWGAYFVHNTLFVKRAPIIEGATYPDFGCNFEVFTNREFLELETLGQEVVLNPGEQVTHEESWRLFANVPGGEDEDWVRSVIVPLAGQNSS
jgi:hypothetical protein